MKEEMKIITGEETYTYKKPNPAVEQRQKLKKVQITSATRYFPSGAFAPFFQSTQWAS